ncbi:ABC transporter ATP-binding protein [Streptococcus agalactiae]|uniref:ABC transporter ATP-binding protein n=1 Tax=Streptococcus agalactiae TaxID=1311 RepID=UPI003C75AB81
MKSKLMDKYGITEDSSIDLIKASIASFWKNVVYMFPITLILFFLMNISNSKYLQEWFYFVSILIVFVVMYYFTNRQYIKSYSTTFKGSKNLRIELVEIIKRLPLSYFSTHDLTDLSQTVMADVSKIEQALSHAICAYYGWIGYFVFLSLSLLIGSLQLGLCIIVPVITALLILYLSKNIQYRINRKYYKKLRENSQAFQDSFEMQQDIKSYNMQHTVRKDVQDRLKDSEKIQIKTELFTTIPSSLLSILPQFSIALVIIFGFQLYLTGQIQLIFYIGYIICATKVASGFTGILDSLLMIINFQSSFKQVMAIRKTPLQEGVNADIQTFNVEFRDVSFAYEKGRNVVSNLSFNANQGEVTAIVGPSGCGKSTILRLLSRLYDYNAGQILIGGKDISEISTNSLFENISTVFQDVELFDDTIFENIKCGNPKATIEEVLEAAKIANVDEIADKFVDKYDTKIGENGSKLSGGERQRISIARAILKDAPIILLDEISASLDIENEIKIQAGLDKLIKNKTVIIVSHRMKSIENANKIIVIENGKVENFGTHSYLLENSTRYRKLVECSQLASEYEY